MEASACMAEGNAIMMPIGGSAQSPAEVRMFESSFAVLRPLCAKLAAEPSLDMLDLLAVTWPALPAEAVQDILDYIIFPLHLTLRRPGIVEAVFISALDQLTALLTEHHVTNATMFYDLFDDLSVAIKHGSEERQRSSLVAMRVLSACLGDTSGSLRAQVVSDQKWMPRFGFVISNLLDVARETKSKELRVLAVECIGRLVRDICHAPSVAPFLPGIAGGVGGLVCGDYKLGSRTFCVSLDTLAAAIALSLADERWEGMPDAESTRVWALDAAARLSVLVRRVASLRVGHPSAKVREALVCFSAALLERCWVTMEASLPAMVEVVVALSADDVPTVSAKAGALLLRLQQRPGAITESLPLLACIEDNLAALLLSLPRTVMAGDDATKRNACLALAGYLDVLGDRLLPFLSAPGMAERLVSALVQVLDVESYDVSVLEGDRDYPLGAALRTIGDGFAHHVRRRFRLFSSDGVRDTLARVCRSVACGRSSAPVMERLRPRIARGSLHARAAGCIVVAFAFSSPHLSDREAMNCSAQRESAVASLLPDLFLCASFARDVDVREGYVLACAALDAVGACVECMGTRFQKHVMGVLYSTVGLAGDEDGRIAQSARRALQSMCGACGYTNASALICENADYIVDSTALMLRRGETSGEASRVLAATLALGGPALVPFLDDALAAVLTSMDPADANLTQTSAMTLVAVLRALEVWALKECELGGIATTTNESKRDTVVAVGSVLARLCARSAKTTAGSARDAADDDATGDAPGGESTHDADVPDGEDGTRGDPDRKAAPGVTALVSRAMDAILPLLGWEPRLRRAALAGCGHALGALHAAGATTDFLPAVHRTWSPIAPCLADGDALVVAAAAGVLSSVCRTARDFVRTRFVRDVWPHLRGRLLRARQSDGTWQSTDPHARVVRVDVALFGLLCAAANADVLDEPTRKAALVMCAGHLVAGDAVEDRQRACAEAMAALAADDVDSAWLCIAATGCAGARGPSVSASPALEPVFGVPWEGRAAPCGESAACRGLHAIIPTVER